MSEGSRYASYFVKETVSGVTPAVAAFKVFRATKSGIDINVATLQSDELRPDAEISDFRLGTRHVAGTATAELSYGTFDDLLAAVLRGSWVTNSVVSGIERPSFTFIDHNTDIVDLPYTVYRGCEINSLSIKVTTNGMIICEFGIVGRTMEQLQVLPAGWTISARSLTAPMDSFAGYLSANGAKNSVVTELTIEINNGIEPRFVIGSNSSIKPGAKRRNITGSLTAYFEDNSLRLAFLNELVQSIALVVSDGSAGNTYEFILPRCKLTEAPRPIDGEGDVMQNIGYRGLVDAATGGSMKINRKTVVPDAQGVLVSPVYVPSMAVGGVQNFGANVLGTTAQTVTWTVEPAANGTITAAGAFTSKAGAAGETVIKATSTKTAAVSGTARIGAIV